MIVGDLQWRAGESEDHLISVYPGVATRVSDWQWFQLWQSTQRFQQRLEGGTDRVHRKKEGWLWWRYGGREGGQIGFWNWSVTGLELRWEPAVGHDGE